MMIGELRSDLMMWIPRGHAQHAMNSHVMVTGCSAPSWKSESHSWTLSRAQRLDWENSPEEEPMFLRNALPVSPPGKAWELLGGGNTPACGVQLTWGMWSMCGLTILCQILGSKAGGRLFCYMNIQEWVKIKLLLSLWCYKRNSFGFYIEKKASCL